MVRVLWCILLFRSLIVSLIKYVIVNEIFDLFLTGIFLSPWIYLLWYAMFTPPCIPLVVQGVTWYCCLPGSVAMRLELLLLLVNVCFILRSLL